MTLENLFDALGGDDADAMARLHRRLERDAEHADLLDVGYRTLDTPLGSLLLAATPIGLVRVAYANEDHDAVLEMLAREVSPRILRTPARLDGAAREIEQYLAGGRTRFDLPLDLRLTAGFRRRVIEHLRDIDYGHRESYGVVPQRRSDTPAPCGRSAAPAHATPFLWWFRATGVIRADGSIGQYVGGVAAKQTLLNLEAP